MSLTSIVDILKILAETRNGFQRNLLQLNDTQRDSLGRSFFSSEQLYFSLLSNVLVRNYPITITFPNILSGFSDPVPVIATQEQINREVETFSSSSLQVCSICQDGISSDGSRLRVCQHSFHRSCIEMWFRASVRCPICRRDIREDPSSQTSSASTGISSQVENQWGGEDIEE
jgi:hypothetical protein